MRCILVVVLSTLIGCASSHGPLEPPGDASTTTPADAMVPDDGGIHDMPEPLATAAELELVGDWWVSDAIATVDGEVCISGRRRGLEGSPLLPEVGRQDAFVACFDPSGRTRVRTWPCAGYSFGAGMLAANDAGDLFVELPDRCSHGDAHSVSILRLDRALDERASAGFVASESPMPRVNGLGATDAHVDLAGRHLSADRWGGFLLSADSSTFEPRWAQGLPIGYQEYRVLVLPDGHIAVVASRARDGVPGMNLTFYRGE